MKKFLLFLVGLAALGILLANLGPMVLLGVSLWLLYIVFKKFIQSETTAGKIGWVVLGLIIMSVAISNIYAVIGLAAAYVLYLIYKHWNDKQESEAQVVHSNDPFTNFEKQWAELNK